MAIDRVGKGGAPPPVPAAEKPSATERSFSVDVGAAANAGAAAEVAAPTASSPLAQLRAGQIDLDRYMDLKVDEATRHLPPLSSVELDDLKKLLKDQMATDPGLVDLVHAATGRTPTPPED